MRLSRVFVFKAADDNSLNWKDIVKSFWYSNGSSNSYAGFPELEQSKMFFYKSFGKLASKFNDVYSILMN